MPPAGNEQKPVLHLAYLDSVRGIAAMIVVVYHFLNWDYKDKTLVKLSNFIFNGADAVAFFFVLSGFVLSYKYLVLKHELDIGKFCMNRIFRLWPAFFITVVINALYHTYLHLGISVQTLVDQFILNKHKFWDEALLVRAASYVYYVPGWTLTLEFTMSLFVPFAIIIAKQNARYTWWLAGFFLLAMPTIVGQGMFMTHFLYGVIVAAYYHAITAEPFKKSVFYKYRYLFLMIGLLFFSVRPIEKMISLGSFYDKVIFEYLGYEVYYFSGIGSFILLVFIIYTRSLHKILEHSIARFFGKISYGVYLMHWLVVIWIFNNRPWLSAYFPDNKTAFALLLVGCVIVTVVLATIVYYCIELPFIRLGRRITAKMRPTIVVPGSSVG